MGFSCGTKSESRREEMMLTNIVNHKRLAYTVIGFIFVASGLVINFLQFVIYISVKPFSKRLFTEINKHLAYSLFSQLMFLQKYWANVKVSLYCEKFDWDNYLGKESALVILNHSYEIDWLIGWALSHHFGFLGSHKIFAKKSLQYVPTIGFAWKLGGSIFLERNWEKDKKRVENKLQEITTDSKHNLIWLFLTAEGTRFTKEKHEASVKFAKKHGLPVLKHHLTPRTKGFTTTVPSIRSKIKAVYNATAVIKDTWAITPRRVYPRFPERFANIGSCWYLQRMKLTKSRTGVKGTFANVLLGKTIEAGLFLERFQMEELPESEIELSRWLHKLYERKDDLVDNYLTTGHWLQDSDSDAYINYELPRGKIALVNFLFWAFTLLASIIYFLTKIIISQSIICFSMTFAVFVFFILIFEKLIGESQISKGSSYGTALK